MQTPLTENTAQKVMMASFVKEVPEKLDGLSTKQNTELPQTGNDNQKALLILAAISFTIALTLATKLTE